MIVQTESHQILALAFDIGIIKFIVYLIKLEYSSLRFCPDM